MSASEKTAIGLQVSDVSGQKVFNVGNVPTDGTVGQLVHQLLAKMNLPQNDATGRPLTYHARLEREGRHLHSDEKIGDALLAGDNVVLQPNIDAGGAAAV